MPECPECSFVGIMHEVDPVDFADPDMSVAVQPDRPEAGAKPWEWTKSAGDIIATVGCAKRAFLN